MMAMQGPMMAGPMMGGPMMQQPRQQPSRVEQKPSADQAWQEGQEEEWVEEVEEVPHPSTRVPPQSLKRLTRPP